ncbi:MAG: hypothetical protein PF481_05970 [Bacteroidales bacterium]|jgi:hypothetical protein|nr:hypothetical protein [Bacteroidales bacterium]
MKRNFLVAVLIGVSALFFFQCSKQRIEEELISYESLDDYFESKKPEEQVYTIDTLGTCPIVGNLGTLICVDKSNLQFPNGDSIYYPYILKLVELYSPRDMIYFYMSHTNDDGLYGCEGVTRVRFFKNDAELELRNQGTWSLEMPSISPQESISVMYQDESEQNIRFVASSQNFTVLDSTYSAQMEQTGWTSGGKTILNQNVASVSFNSETDDLETVTIYVYLPDYKCLIHVQNPYEGLNLPINAAVKIIGMAIDSDEQLYSYYKEFTLEEETELSVTLSEATDGSLTAYLSSL